MTPDEVPEEPPEQPAVTPPTRRRRPRARRASPSAGAWMEASAAWRSVLEAEPKNVVALRGAAMTWLEAADAVARRGQVAEAHASLDDLIAWLTRMYDGRLRAGQPPGAAGHDRLPLGFALDAPRRGAHREGALVPRAGNAAAQKAATEGGLRRPRISPGSSSSGTARTTGTSSCGAPRGTALNGDPRSALADLAVTTEIEQRAGAAADVGRALQRAAPPGRACARGVAAAPRSEIGAADAADSSEAASRGRGAASEAFTRDQWLDAARVLLVHHLAVKQPRRTGRRDPRPDELVSSTQAHRTAGAGVGVGERRRGAAPALEAGLALAHVGDGDRPGRVVGGRPAAGRGAGARPGGPWRCSEEVAAGGGALPAPYPYVDPRARVCRPTGADAIRPAAAGEGPRGGTKQPRVTPPLPARTGQAACTHHDLQSPRTPFAGPRIPESPLTRPRKLHM